jgi:NAD(P)-dependent dehydrogenase (short-subunit alcohol dehydrogenase family)
MSRTKTETRVALITGASSGFGLGIAARFAALGMRVFGTSRSGQGGAAGVELLALDVDQDASVRAAVAEVLSRAGRLDILVNNAGRAMVGAGEETSADEARSLFETNLFGVMRMVSAALPAMRQQRRGAIVNVGSASGFVGVPFHGVYAASKHALAGYTEALRYEVRSLGITVSLVEPAAHRTGISMIRPRSLLPHYDGDRGRVEAIIRAQIDGGDSPERVVDAVMVAATHPSPRFRYRVGNKARLGAFARWLLPEGLFERFVRREFQLAARDQSAG